MFEWDSGACTQIVGCVPTIQHPFILLHYFSKIIDIYRLFILLLRLLIITKVSIVDYGSHQLYHRRTFAFGMPTLEYVEETEKSNTNTSNINDDSNKEEAIF